MGELPRKPNEEFLIGSPVQLSIHTIREKVDTGSYRTRIVFRPARPCYMRIERHSGETEVWTLVGIADDGSHVLGWSGKGNSLDTDKVKAVPIGRFRALNPGVEPEPWREEPAAKTEDTETPQEESGKIRRFLAGLLNLRKKK